MNELKVAIKAAKAAGKIHLKYFNKPIDLSFKKNNEFVTNVDIKAENKILSIIKKYFPDHSFWSEESGISGNSIFRWVIDPLDGTEMFAHALPTFGVSISLEKNLEPILGVTFFPLLNMFFTCEKGKGVFCNGVKCTVSKTTKAQKPLVFEGLKDRSKGKWDDDFKKHKATARDFGSTALALSLLAMGRFDVVESGIIKPCDISAGMLFVREAGGKVLTPSGKRATSNSKRIMATNGSI